MRGQVLKVFLACFGHSFIWQWMMYETCGRSSVFTIDLPVNQSHERTGARPESGSLATYDDVQHLLQEGMFRK